MIRVGLEDIGFMGFSHYEAHMKIPKVKLAAIADYNTQKLAVDWGSIGGNLGVGPDDNRDLNGIKTYEKDMDMINDTDVDMIDICMLIDLKEATAIANFHPSVTKFMIHCWAG